MIRATIEHPATRELAGAGLLFLPVRYVPLGWAATWAARRLIGRIASKPVRPIKNVTPNPG